MLPATLIVKKRDGHRLRDDEIEEFIGGYVAGDVADYQMAAMAMAICTRGMETEEIATLTRVMLESGDRLPRHSTNNTVPRVDKHSTGGLGDKVSLILAPWLAACDVHVPMISGRGLGLTGGTLDKLESIEGFNVNFESDQADQLLDASGCFIISASSQIAPADRKLYALRDVSGTVESVPLITASILSKKLAASLDALVMDVKFGSGAFMKSYDQAIELAQSIKRVGEASGLPTRVLMTDMDQPLGWAVGNAIEVNESLEVLNGKVGSTTHELTRQLCASLLVQCGRSSDLQEALDLLDRRLADGSARERFDKMIAAQGGSIDQPLTLENPTIIEAPGDGYIQSIDCQTMGEVLVSLGAGRRRKEDLLQHRVGIRIDVRVGDEVRCGEPMLTLYSDKATDLAIERCKKVVSVTREVVAANPLVRQTL
ncbi:MAG: thymidine phosphorylase [Planctomycetota bacterium]